MSRLIDADELLRNEIARCGCQPLVNDNKLLKDVINEQPTAYDIDEKVKQLEELEKEHLYKVVGEPETYSQYNEAWQDCIDRVIGIVKGGAK